MSFQLFQRVVNKSRRQQTQHLAVLSAAATTLWVAKNQAEDSDVVVTDEDDTNVDDGTVMTTRLWSSLQTMRTYSIASCSAKTDGPEQTSSSSSSSLPTKQQPTATADKPSTSATPKPQQQQQQVMAPSLAATESQHRTFAMRRRATMARLNKSMTMAATLELKYEVNPDPIGEGAFGQVFVARDKSTMELVAVKKIWKEYSDNADFVREMSALLQIRSHGGHPHICQLRENFEQSEHYSLVLDLVKGGEMFDHLVESGAYSELDASRLIREVASALAFLHGIGLVHCDLKPENLMLSSKTDSATIKLVDFGCSEQLPGHEGAGRAVVTPGQAHTTRSSGGTVAYSPPESFLCDDVPVDAPLDMWSLGIILHIMLTGMHPFDAQGDATDDVLQGRIQGLKEAPDLHTPDTEHLSESAIDLLSQLLQPDPTKRLKAHEMLEHSWVRGDTARSDVMEDSDRKLSKFRKFLSKIETKVFQELIRWSVNKFRTEDSASQTGESLVEKAFKSLDTDAKGFLTIGDIHIEPLGQHRPAVGEEDSKEKDEESNEISLSAFSDLLGANMQNKYFPAGHVVFDEGDPGEHMYFLNSGTCAVTTKGGFQHILKHGDTFGEGGLINESGKRSATIKTITPVHAIQIDRECFAKYLMGSDSALALQIKERVNKRRFGRAEFIVGNQEGLETLHILKGQKVFSTGEKPDAIYFIADGTIDVKNEDKHTVYHITPGELLGVRSFLMQRLRDTDAVCISPACKVKVIPAGEFQLLTDALPELKASLHELALRREFQRAIVRKLKSSFTTMNLKEVFDAIDLDQSGLINREELRDLLTHLEVTISDDEVKLLLETLDLDSTGFINFEEFTTLFA